MTTKQPRSYTIRREGSVPILKGGALKELIEYIALSLVEDPSQVEVSQFKTGGKVHFELRVAKEDMGRVIGKGGKVANAIRVLLRVAAAAEGKQVILDVAEPR
jgi:predicted RNA-binding protein YlqC (UPF0109 family)